jgi:two-component system sensor histidine kinase KdpD
MADEVVNIDLTADDLIARLREGKKSIRPIKSRPRSKIFFKSDQILQTA